MGRKSQIHPGCKGAALLFLSLFPSVSYSLCPLKDVKIVVIYSPQKNDLFSKTEPNIEFRK